MQMLLHADLQQNRSVKLLRMEIVFYLVVLLYRIIVR